MQMDGLIEGEESESKVVMVLAATNHPWDIGLVFVFKFPLYSLRFPLTRETDTNISRSIVNNLYYSKIAIWHLPIWQNWCFSQFYHSKIEVFQISQLLA